MNKLRIALICGCSLIAGHLFGQAPMGIYFDGNVGKDSFINFFSQPNASYASATWAAAAGGPNVAGQVQVSGNQTGEVVYNGVNTYQNGTYSISFSLSSYVASNTNQIGLLFGLDGSGNGYGVIVNPVLSGSTYFFQYRLFAVAGYVITGSSLKTVTSTAVPSTSASTFFTLSVAISGGNTCIAQLYDSTGSVFGGSANLTPASFSTAAGEIGFRLWGSGAGYGASAYQLVAVPAGASVAYHAPKVIYVATGGTGTGATTNAPYGSITAAVNTATNAGTIVQVAAGTYFGEAIHFPTAANGTYVTNTVPPYVIQPIVLEGAPGTAAGSTPVLVKGSKIVTNWTSGGSYYSAPWTNSFGAWNTNSTNVDARYRPRNQLFQVDNSYAPPYNQTPMAEVASLAEVGGTVNYTNQVGQATYSGTFFINSTNHTAYLALPGNANPNSSVIELTSTSGPLLRTSTNSGVVVRNMTFENCANISQSLSGLVEFNGGALNQIDSCNVYFAAGAGAGSAFHNNLLITNSVFQWNGQEGIACSGSTNSMVIDSDTSYNNTLPNKQFDPGFEAGGNKFANTVNMSVIGQTSVGNFGPGVWFDSCSKGATIKDGLFYDNAGGIAYEISYTATICDNYCYNGAMWGAGINTPSAIGIYLSSSAGCQVYNNTCVGNAHSGIASYGAVRSDGNGGTVASYANSIYNNILASNEQWYAASIILDLSTSTTASNTVVPFAQNTSDYNLFYISNGGQENFFQKKVGGVDGLYTTISAWKTGSGVDAHSVWGDPLFNNYLLNYPFLNTSPSSPWVSYNGAGSSMTATAAGLQVGDASAAAVSLSSTHGTYVTVSANVRVGNIAGTGANNGVFLGFIGSTSSLTPGNSQYYGVVFGPTGTLSLQQGGTTTVLATYNASKLGAFSTSNYYPITFTINTETGEIFDVILFGPSGKQYFAPQSGGFEGTTLGYAAFYCNGTSGTAYLNNFTVRDGSNLSLAPGSPALGTGSGAVNIGAW